MTRLTPASARLTACAAALVLWLAALSGTGCGDTGITGTALDNRPPNTELSVRDTSLVDNIGDEDRLSSTVFISWSGTDPDGFVSSYELRFYDQGTRVTPEEGWSVTTRTDTLILLPLARGERQANVVFAVRARDNEGALDPTPAQTVFPIQNAPPTIALGSFEQPPDTTFTVISFAWRADDPEGAANLDRVEVSLNDSLNFVSLPPDVEFVTFVGQVDRDDPTQTEAEARVYTGRGFQRTDIFVPGLLLDADNVLYLRAVDQTDTTSVRVRYPAKESDTWYVKKPGSRILYVNDYRKSVWPALQEYHLDLLRAYLPAGTPIDTWHIAEPFVSGSAGNVPRSSALPPVADPMLRETLPLYDFIYWVSTNTTESVQGNNLPFVAGVADRFFADGGTMMVHSPIALPANPEDRLGNPAILLLPLSDLITFPDTLVNDALRVFPNTLVTPVTALPGLGMALPTLKFNAFSITLRPFIAESENTIPLLRTTFTAFTQPGNRPIPWPGSETVAAISADLRVALFALPMINEQTGVPVLVGEDDDPDAPRRAVMLMLESLGFPKR